MDTKALRQKILDLAIRGKLVPQDPNDEPASVLLERIRQQKQQMVKEGKLKPKDIKNDSVIFLGEDNLHYEKFADGSVKCIEDEIPFELPEGWAWSRIRDIASVKGGKRLPKGMSFSSCRTSHAYIRVTDMKNHSVNTDDLKYITEEVFSQIKNYTISKDDLYVTIAGTIGVTGEVPAELDGMSLTENAVKVTDIQINKAFLCLVLQSEFVQQQFQDKTHQVAMPKLALERILSTLIPVCSITVQSGIVSKFGEVDSLINLIGEEKEVLTEVISLAKSKILDLAIRSKLVPQDPNDEPASVLLERIRAEKEELIKQGKIKRDKKESVIFRGEDNSYYEKMPDGKLHCLDDQLPFELPDGWEWCNLSMIGTTNIGLTYRPTNIEPDGVIVLRSCNIVNDQVDLSDLVRVKTTIRENQYVQKNDILICARNGSRALVGKCALIPDLGEPASFGAFMAIYRTEYFEYIVHYLRSSFFRSVFDDSNSTAINQLTQDMLKRAIVPLPPVFEQRRITETIDAMLFELNQMEKSLI